MPERLRFEREIADLNLHEYFWGPFIPPSPAPTVGPVVAVRRRMKFELQTGNVVYRVLGNKGIKLPRKFGPKNSQFLHRGTTGAPARIDLEGSAIELQSEANGFVEFETSDWHHTWCAIKTRLQEAKAMVDTLMDPSNPFKTFEEYDGKGHKIRDHVRGVLFPWNVDHLRARSYKHRLKPGELLAVEIKSPTWSAKIQVSESFELSQFESYLKEHTPDLAAEIIAHARKILNNANASKTPDIDLVNLLNFLQIIVQHIKAGQTFDLLADPKDPAIAKRAFWLMSRTNFASMYQELLSATEKDLFKEIVQHDGILTQMGLTRKTKFFMNGFFNMKARWRHELIRNGLTVFDWLRSIIKPFAKRSYGKKRVPADMLSLISGDSHALGRYLVETDAKNDERHLVKFEARDISGHAQDRPVTRWLDFAGEVFKQASLNRSRPGSSLDYRPASCP